MKCGSVAEGWVWLHGWGGVWILEGCADKLDFLGNRVCARSLVVGTWRIRLPEATKVVEGGEKSVRLRVVGRVFFGSVRERVVEHCMRCS